MAKTVQDHIARLRSIGDRPRATGSTGSMGATGNIGEQVSRLRAIAAERGQQINSIQDLIKAWEEEDLDVMELLKNIPSSAYQFGSDVVDAVSDPVGMATNIGKVGVGIADLPFRAAGTEATGLQREGREALGQMASQMAGSLTPSALTERPVEGLANLAVGSGSALKGLSGLAKLGRMPGVAQTLQTAGKAAMAADPTVLPFKAAGAATRATGRGAARMATAAGERASTAGSGVRGKASELGSRVSASIGGTSPTGKKVPLWKEIIAGGLAFTTGTSPGTILLAMEKARGGFGDIIRNARKDREGAWEDIAKRLAKATEKAKVNKDNLFQQAKNDIRESKVLEEVVPHSDMVPGIESLLNRYGIELIKEVKPNSVDVGKLPAGAAGRYDDIPITTENAASTYTNYKVKFSDRSAVAERGVNRKTIEREVEALLNKQMRDGRDQFDAFTVEHVMNRRNLLNDSISAISPLDDVSRSTRAILSDLRTQMGTTFRQRIDAHPDLDTSYLGRYEDAMIQLDEFESMLGVSPSTLTGQGKFQEGFKTEFQTKMNKALTEGREGAFKRLRELEEIGEDNTIVARMVGAAMQPLLGSGLVVKSEISQAFRAAAGMGAGLWQAPAVILFSPRAVNELLIKAYGPNGPTMAGARAQAQTLVQSVRAMQPKLRPLGIDLKELAKEGVTVGILLERLQETADAEEQQMRK
jgi:hypothetical protein